MSVQKLGTYMKNPAIDAIILVNNIDFLREYLFIRGLMKQAPKIAPTGMQPFNNPFAYPSVSQILQAVMTVAMGMLPRQMSIYPQQKEDRAKLQLRNNSCLFDLYLLGESGVTKAFRSFRLSLNILIQQQYKGHHLHQIQYISDLVYTDSHIHSSKDKLPWVNILDILYSMGKKSKSKNNQPQTQQKKPQSEPNTQEKVVLTDLNAIMKQLQDNQQKGGKKKSKKMNSMVVDQAQRSSKDNKQERASAFAWQSIGHHDNSGDLWVVIKEGVYNLTKMVDNHPGGKKVITVRGGRDATKAFASGNHPESVIQKKLPKYLMGALNKDSTRQQWQSEQKQGRKDCLLALFLSCSIISFMIYLV